VDRRRAVQHGIKGLLSPANWWRAVRRGLQAADIKRAAHKALGNSRASLTGVSSHPQIPAQRMAEAWQTINRHGTRITLVFSEREPLLLEMEAKAKCRPREFARSIGPHRERGTYVPARMGQKIVHDVMTVTSNRFSTKIASIHALRSQRSPHSRPLHPPDGSRTRVRPMAAAPAACKLALARTRNQR